MTPETGSALIVVPVQELGVRGTPYLIWGIKGDILLFWGGNTGGIDRTRLNYWRSGDGGSLATRYHDYPKKPFHLKYFSLGLK